MEKITLEGYVICAKKPCNKQLVDFELNEEYLFHEVKEEIKAGSERISLCYFKVFPNPDFLSFSEIVRQKEFNEYFKIIR